MKKIFTNNEVEQILTTISAKDSFVNTAKMPAQIRQAIRVNRKTLTERMTIYQEGRNEILQNYIKNGYAHQDGNNVQVDEQYRPAIVQEFTELAMVKNDLDVEGIDKHVLENFLNTNELTMAEEDVLLLFENKEP